jgi:hypothetical protein
MMSTAPATPENRPEPEPRAPEARPSTEEINRYLDEDVLTKGEYEYVAISFCASKTRQKLDKEDKVALKIRGAFRSVQDGIDHIKKLHNAKETFDTYLCDMGKWTLIGNVDGIEHPETHLVDMVKVIHDKNADHKRQFEERKERTKEHGLDDDECPPAKRLKEDPKQNDLSQITPLTLDTQTDESFNTSFSAVDTITVPDANVAILSFCDSDPDRRTVETPQGCVGVKFRGAFATKKEAEEFLDSTLSKLERDVDMFIVDMYKWLLLPPHVDEIKDVRYREDFLQDMFSSYEESQKAAKIHQIERQKAMDLDTIMEGDTSHPTEIQAQQESS